MKRVVEAYFEEAKWANSDYTPSTEEYMGVALASSAYPLLAATSFVGMGCNASEEAFHWLTTDPLKVLRALTIIARLMDDIVSHEVYVFICIELVHKVQMKDLYMRGGVCCLLHVV